MKIFLKKQQQQNDIIDKRSDIQCYEDMKRNEKFQIRKQENVEMIESDFPVSWNVGWNGIEMKCEKFVEFPTKIL